MSIVVTFPEVELTGSIKSAREYFLVRADRLAEANSAFFSDKSMSSFEHSRRRENALCEALIYLAASHGCTLKPIHCIDSQGELFLSVASEGFGEAFAEVLSSIPTRTGVQGSQIEVLPENGWCRIHHFDAERIVTAFVDYLKHLETRK